MINFLIAFIACVIGSLIGIGGGVIIVPLLLLTGVPKELAAFTSSATVFAMAVLSTVTYVKRKQGSMKSAILIGLGSIPGSTIGVGLNKSMSDDLFNLSFAAIILLIIIVMVCKDRLPKFEISDLFKPLLGVFVGLVSGIFGIGGGPIVVPILLILFSMKQKEASATSVFVTLITTTNALLTYFSKGTFDMSLAIYMIPAAIIGAKIGTNLNKKFDDKALNNIFIGVMALILVKQIFI